MVKVISVLVSIAGVAMTIVGKTWTAGGSQSSTAKYVLSFRDIIKFRLFRGRYFLAFATNIVLVAFFFPLFVCSLTSVFRDQKHSLLGDLYAALSALTYGLFTGEIHNTL